MTLYFDQDLNRLLAAPLGGELDLMCLKAGSTLPLALAFYRGEVATAPTFTPLIQFAIKTAGEGTLLALATAEDFTGSGACYGASLVTDTEAMAAWLAGAASKNAVAELIVRNGDDGIPVSSQTVTVRVANHVIRREDPAPGPVPPSGPRLARRSTTGSALTLLQGAAANPTRIARQSMAGPADDMIFTEVIMSGGGPARFISLEAFDVPVEAQVEGTEILMWFDVQIRADFANPAITRDPLRRAGVALTLRDSTQGDLEGGYLNPGDLSKLVGVHTFRGQARVFYLDLAFPNYVWQGSTSSNVRVESTDMHTPRPSVATYRDIETDAVSLTAGVPSTLHFGVALETSGPHIEGVCIITHKFGYKILPAG